MSSVGNTRWLKHVLIKIKTKSIYYIYNVNIENISYCISF